MPSVPSKIYPGLSGGYPGYIFRFFNKNFSENISWISGVKVSKKIYKTKNYFTLRLSCLSSKLSLVILSHFVPENSVIFTLQ